MNLNPSLFVRLTATCAVALGALSASPAAARPTPLTDRLLEPGPHSVGTATLPLVDESRPTPPNGESYAGSPVRTLVTDVYFPEVDIAANAGKFPLIVHGHGLGSTRQEMVSYATHLASHGFVVASLDFPLSNAAAPGGPTTADVTGQVGDVLYVEGVLTSAEVLGFFPIAALIDTDRVALSGYSLGGVTAALAAEFAGAYLGADEIDAVYMMAPASCALFLPGGPGVSLDIPAFMIGGDDDAITPFDKNLAPLNDALSSPKYLVEIEGGSHGGFIDIAPQVEASGYPVDAYICGAIGGVDPAEQAACSVCTDLPTEIQVSGLRQASLARASSLAFFNAYLRGRVLSAAYLQHLMRIENPELDVTFTGRFGEGVFSAR